MEFPKINFKMLQDSNLQSSDLQSFLKTFKIFNVKVDRIDP